jgi:hypothetical protein
MKVTVSHLYLDLDGAWRAIARLTAAGVAQEEISLVASAASRDLLAKPGFSGAVERDVKIGRLEYDVETGGAAGAVIGGLTGLVTSLAIPGIGPIIAIGWMKSVFLGVAGGALLGGGVGALLELGHSKDEAEHFAQGLRGGGALVSVRVPQDEADRFADILEDGVRRAAE